MNRAYTQALAFILSLTDMERRPDLSGARAMLGLERMRFLLDRIAHPELTFWSVHVAGTKGKGSTSAMIERVLRTAGLRTGLYTSPHLHTFRERIRVGGRSIAQADLASLTGEIRPVVESMPDRPSTFEVATAIAMLYFARQRVDTAVLEVGLGGRLDATNVVTPRVSVITAISFDHMAILGNTLAEIAREKAGIIKSGIPVVSAPQPAEALAVIEQIAHERHAPLTLVGRDVAFQVTDASETGLRVAIEGPGYRHIVRPNLMGEHQAANAATAVAAMEVLRRQGVSLTSQDIAFGLRRVRWPGRLEIIARRPTIIVDGAHNVDSAEKLKSALDMFFPLQHRRHTWPDQPAPGQTTTERSMPACRPRVLLIGMSADKDADGIMAALVPGADIVIVTRANHPRAAGLEWLQAAAAPYAPTVLAIPDLPAALAAARDHAGQGGLICASASLFIVADVRALVKGLHQEILPIA